MLDTICLQYFHQYIVGNEGHFPKKNLETQLRGMIGRSRILWCYKMCKNTFRIQKKLLYSFEYNTFLRKITNYPHLPTILSQSRSLCYIKMSPLNMCHPERTTASGTLLNLVKKIRREFEKNKEYSEKSERFCSKIMDAT